MMDIARIAEVNGIDFYACKKRNDQDRRQMRRHAQAKARQLTRSFGQKVTWQELFQGAPAGAMTIEANR